MQSHLQGPLHCFRNWHWLRVVAAEGRSAMSTTGVSGARIVHRDAVVPHALRYAVLDCCETRM
jgi:hypothetical protein